MEKMNFVFGHKKPDTDSIASAISMANLQTNMGDYSESFRLGNVNRETEFALKTFGVKTPELLDKVDENSNVIMVDSNEFDQSADGIEKANIKMIVDHHRLNLQTSNPVFCMVEPVGCTSTILYKLYKQNDIDITPEMAGMMLSAIVSDTLLFKSPTCTEQDKLVASRLSSIAGMSMYDYGLNMLKAGTNLDGYTSEQVINTDSKPFEKNGIKFVISQINSADVDNVLEKQKDLEHAIENEILLNNLDCYIFMVTDILEASSKVIVLGNRRDIFEKAYETKLCNNLAILNGVVSRKKQVLPKILDAIQ